MLHLIVTVFSAGPRYNGVVRRGGSGTVIYADVLFAMNTLIDYLLLLGAARLSGEPLYRGRFTAGAILGGLYAVLVFLPGLSFLYHPLCKLSCCGLMLTVAYGRSRRLIRQSLIFLSLSMALAGGVLGVGLLGGELTGFERGICCSAPDLKLVLLSAGICYAVVTAVLGKIGAHSRTDGELIPIQIRLGSGRQELMALVDTGNTLTDPILGRPVIVANGPMLSQSLNLPLSERELRDPVSAIAKIRREAQGIRTQLIPYRAVGVSRAMLLAIRADEVRLDGEKKENMLVALSPTPVSDGGGYQALVGEAALRL